ncbi:hypothetical protein SAMN05216467_2136 [Cellulomonas sp. KH9]|nr:hypothetical protein SAMN05216467_2136 [Cellulomonas sp. KH9]
MNQRRAAHVVSRVGGQLVELGQAAGGALGVPFVKQARDQGTPGQHAVGARTLSSSRGEHLEQLTRDGPGEPVRSAQCCVEVGRRWLTGVRRRDAPHGAADVHRQCAVEHGVHEPVPQRIVVRGRAVVCGGDCVAQSPVGSGAIGAIHRRLRPVRRHFDGMGSTARAERVRGRGAHLRTHPATTTPDAAPSHTAVTTRLDDRGDMVEIRERTLQGLRDAGLAGFAPFARLPDAHVPTHPGVYVVVRDSSEPAVFLESSVAGWFKAKNPSVELNRLLARTASLPTPVRPALTCRVGSRGSRPAAPAPRRRCRWGPGRARSTRAPVPGRSAGSRSLRRR